MKMIKCALLAAMCCVAMLQYAAQTQRSNSNPKSFSSFYKKDTTKVAEGYYAIYQNGDKYFLQIPEKGLGRDILITAQVARGYSRLVSPASGVIRLVKNRENKLDLIKAASREVSADSTDLCMISALRNSGLIPVAKSFPIVAYGADGKSPIIELTSELNSASGLFNVTTLSTLSHPDPARSGVVGFHTIDRGAVFSVKRSQTDYQVNPATRHGEDIVNTFLLEMVVQEIPEHKVDLKKNHLAYGFNTISLSEYNSKRYAVFKNDYIQRWMLNASPKDRKRQLRGEAVHPQMQICVYIDPVIPAPFVESITKAVDAWNAPFFKAGWKDVFKISRDDKDAALSYKKIIFRWGNSYNDNTTSLVTNPANGEILCARINFMDEIAKGLLKRYVLQCSQVDSRILKDFYSLDIRKEILSVQLEALLANVLGLKDNNTASTAFSPENFRSEKWLSQYGTSASITSEFTFNYLLKPGDKVSPRNMMPRISTYDYDAIAYAYGKSTSAPSLKSTFYVAQDKSDPYAMGFMSCDVIAASETGMSSLEAIFPRINSIVRNMPADQNTWDQVSELTAAAFSLHSGYLYQIGKLVGGRSKRPIIPGDNEVPVTYVPKAEQLRALDYLRENLFTEIPAWLSNDSLLMAKNLDLKDRLLGTVQVVMKDIVSKETIATLIAAERQMGNKAFTCDDLLEYIDRVFFKNFDPKQPLTLYQQNVQAYLISQLISCAKENSIAMGVTDESAIIHSALVRIARKVKVLSESHTDPKCREYYQLMVIKMNREYFDK
jgi:hypothetical protein